MPCPSFAIRSFTRSTGDEIHMNPLQAVRRSTCRADQCPHGASLVLNASGGWFPRRSEVPLGDRARVGADQHAGAGS
jgi:hypothetical protein